MLRLNDASKILPDPVVEVDAEFATVMVCPAVTTWLSWLALLRTVTEPSKT